MRLSTRVVVSVVVVGVVIRLGVEAMGVSPEQRRVRHAANLLATFRMDESTRARCEAAPAQWHLSRDDDKGRALHLFAYELMGGSHNPAAPPLAPALTAGRRILPQGPVRQTVDDVEYDATLVAMPWNGGPCASILVLSPPIGPAGVAALFTRRSLPFLLFMIAPLIVLLPVSRRVERLRDAMVRSSSAGFQEIADERGGDEVADLAHAFNGAAAQVRAQTDELEARDALLRRQVVDMAHDVKTPITTIKSSLNRLLDAVQGGDTGKASRAARVARLEIQFVTDLLRNLEMATRLESDLLPIKTHPIDVRSLIERVVIRHQTLAEDLGVSLMASLGDGPAVMTQGDLLAGEQILANLVQNAILHNKVGGQVCVDLDEEEEHVVVNVRDDGPGLSDEVFRAALESPGRAITSAQERSSSAGLGLGIVHRLAEVLGWRLSLARSSLGGLEVRLHMTRST